jgi:hypothetical protein
MNASISRDAGKVDLGDELDEWRSFGVVWSTGDFQGADAILESSLEYK